MKVMNSLLLATVLSAQSLSACPNALPPKNCQPSQNQATHRFITSLTLKIIGPIIGGAVGGAIGGIVGKRFNESPKWHKWEFPIGGAALGLTGGFAISFPLADKIANLLFPSDCESRNEQKLPPDVLDDITEIPVPTLTMTPTSETGSGKPVAPQEPIPTTKSELLEQIRTGVHLHHVTDDELVNPVEINKTPTSLYDDLLKEVAKHREAVEDSIETEKTSEVDEFNA